MAASFSNLIHVLGTIFRILTMCPLWDLEEQLTDTGASKRDPRPNNARASSRPVYKNTLGLFLALCHSSFCGVATLVVPTSLGHSRET